MKSLFCLLFIFITASESYCQVITTAVFLSFKWKAEGSEMKIEYNGGDEKWKKYIQNCFVKYNDFSSGSRGVRYEVELVVDSIGKVKSVKFLNETSRICESQARRFFYEMPKWNIIQSSSNKKLVKLIFELNTWQNINQKDFVYERAIESFEKKDFSKTIKNFYFAITNEPYNIDAYYSRAACYY